MGERFRGRSALIVGLGSLLAIMAVAGIGALRVLEHVGSRDEQIRQQLLSRNHVLNDIRSEVYLSGTLVRDYLLEPALLRRPSMLDDLGLVTALRWQAREVSKSTAMDVSVAAELSSDDFPDEYKTCIYRVVQEALHNCARHSHAQTVRIRVQQRAGPQGSEAIALSIQDDGQGFDASQIKGLGLLGIQERVHRLGGACRVHSEPGGGTVLPAELPFSPAARSSECVYI